MGPPTRLFSRDHAVVFAVPSIHTIDAHAVTANLVCRVVLALLANLICLVPLRLLYRNGEFAAVVFIALVEVRNLQTIASTLIWRDSDVESWWPGYGLCDLDVLVTNGSVSLYYMCLLAVLRNLARSVGMLRANPLTVKEKRRRNLLQALIMFPLPVIQMALTYPLAAQRFAVGQLAGCTWQPYPAWPYVVFFRVAPIAVAVLTVFYASKCATNSHRRRAASLTSKRSDAQYG